MTQNLWLDRLVISKNDFENFPVLQKNTGTRQTWLIEKFQPELSKTEGKRQFKLIFVYLEGLPY